MKRMHAQRKGYMNVRLLWSWSLLFEMGLSFNLFETFRFNLRNNIWKYILNEQWTERLYTQNPTKPNQQPTTKHIRHIEHCLLNSKTGFHFISKSVHAVLLCLTFHFNLHCFVSIKFQQHCQWLPHINTLNTYTHVGSGIFDETKLKQNKTTTFNMKRNETKIISWVIVWWSHLSLSMPLLYKYKQIFRKYCLFLCKYQIRFWFNQMGYVFGSFEFLLFGQWALPFMVNVIQLCQWEHLAYVWEIK